MKHSVLSPDATPSEIREEIARLRTKQRRACIQSTRDELDRDMGELLDRLPRQADVAPPMIAGR